MKKSFFLTLLATLLCVVSFAQNSLITPPETATIETWYTVDGTFYLHGQGSWEDATADMPTVKVAIDGEDIYVRGLSYWFRTGWIKGSIADGKATFASGQLVGGDSQGDEFIVGSKDGKTVCDIEFAYDSEAGTLAYDGFIVASASATELQAYTYWYAPTFSKTEPEKPQPVVAPEGLETTDYVVAYTDGDYLGGVPIKLGFMENEIYVQGFCSYLPEAWMKGTVDGTTVTFAGNQYFGSYDNRYDMFLQKDNAVFTYDAETGKLSASGLVYTYTGTQYVDYYKNPVMSKVVEMAGTPATPEVSVIGTADGDAAVFMIPMVDTEGNGLVAKKLYVKFYSDIEKEVSPVTFKTSDYSRLTEDMTVVPYGFTENYDFYTDQIYLNMSHDAWNKIGIQTIYYGGDEEHASEIFWFELKPYKGDGPITAPAGLETTDYRFLATALENGYEETKPYDEALKIGRDGDDLYIQGMVKDFPEMWAKATKNAEGQYVIPANEYLGTQTVWGWEFPYYLAAKDAANSATDIVLTYNAEADTYTTPQTVVLNGQPAAWEPYLTFTNVSFVNPNPSGIDTLAASEKKAVVYTLNGQRVETMKKGLYIVNGKKVIK